MFRSISRSSMASITCCLSLNLIICLIYWTVGVLCRPVSWKGRHSNRTRNQWVIEVLAEDLQSEGSDVFRRNRRDIRCDRTLAVRQSPRLTLQTDIAMRLESALSGHTSLHPFYDNCFQLFFLKWMDRWPNGLSISGITNTY